MSSFISATKLSLVALFSSATLSALEPTAFGAGPDAAPEAACRLSFFWEDAAANFLKDGNDEIALLELFKSKGYAPQLSQAFDFQRVPFTLRISASRSSNVRGYDIEASATLLRQRSISYRQQNGIQEDCYRPLRFNNPWDTCGQDVFRESLQETDKAIRKLLEKVPTCSEALARKLDSDEERK